MNKEIKEIKEINQTSLPMQAALSNEMSQMLAEAAKSQSESEKGSTPFISIKGKKFTLEDVKLGTEMDAVIVATTFDNVYYDAPYNPDEIRPPACFSLSVSGEDMVPHADSPLPQHPTCEGCPQNEYGTALQGKGKACKNGRRLLLAAFDSEKGVDTENLAIIRLPPTSLKGAAGYFKSVSTRRDRPVCSVVTTLSMDEDSDWPKVEMAFKDNVQDEEVLHDIIKNLAAFETIVSAPYSVQGFTPYEETVSASKKSKMS